MPCRHHIGERIVFHRWKCMEIEDSTAPISPLFSKFKQTFSSLKYTKYSLSIPKVKKPMREKREKIVSLCQNALQLDQSRGDYKELIVLTLVYLDEAPESFKKFHIPGAISNARWMAKLLYCLKIVLLSGNLEEFKTIFPKEQVLKIKVFVEFVVYCYVPWWITASHTASSPQNDLQMINDFALYEAIHPKIANTAKKALSLHLWYLTEEVLPLSLFSNSLDNETKEEIIKVMLATEKSFSKEKSKRHGTSYGKPTFPKYPKTKVTELCSFAGAECWRFFTILGISPDFLKLPVLEWTNSHSYYESQELVNSLRVVNDSAENGVKLCYDFLSSSKKEQQLQNILQVVENGRHRLPNQRNSGVPSKKWHLKLE